MLDICLLGTGGMMPLPYRWLTSLMMRVGGSQVLIDCGEGTQIAMRKKGWSPNPIDLICFTHYHADHISGLPGLLLDMGNSERREPLTLIGPKGLTRVVSGLRVIAPELPFEVNCVEITEDVQEFSFEDYRITAFKVKHSIPCYGYTLQVDRGGKFDKDRALAQNIPLKLWNPLQKGQTCEFEGVTYTPDMVIGPPRKGLKVTYCTDTRPVPVITEQAAGSDLLILEGMYGDPEDAEKAKQKKHMTMQEAAGIAKELQVPELWLTHFSPAMGRPDEYREQVREIFGSTIFPKDGRSVTLRFEDSEGETTAE